MRVLVLGAAVSGTAAARLARRLGHQVTVFDARTGAGSGLIGDGVGVVTGAWEPDLLTGVDLVVASPGFPLRSAPITDAREAGLAVWSELEFAWRQLEAPVLAVTGTNGKTTTVEATVAMLTAAGVATAALGNIGIPLSEAVGADYQVLVVEASSFQLELTETFHPATSVLLNLAPDHLDWHSSFPAYAAAKAKIYANQGADDLLVYDADDPGLRPLIEPLRGRDQAPRLWPVSGHRRPPDGSGPEEGLLHLPGLQIPLAEIGSSDPVLLSDLTAAAVAAGRHGAGSDAIARVCREFRPGPHRRRLVGQWKGVDFVDDSKATNPHAALTSIASFPSVILIAGGLSKGLDLAPLARADNVRHLVAIGESAPILIAAAGPDRSSPADSMEEAVARAVAAAGPGDTVLLAPGCASFDMFVDYRQRGDSFSEAVQRLIRGGAA
jgi:UDP-N-acetylmuramoylalanine--D-glutamate ligase